MRQATPTLLKYWIPNSITLMNLLAGCVGVSLAAWGELAAACHAVMLAAIFDLLDGWAARALGVASPLGKELDSLADVVSFGLLPAFILFQLAASSPGQPGTEWVVYVYTLSAAVRLARFNQDTRQTHGFIGLASPAAALLLVSAVAWLGQPTEMALGVRVQLHKNWLYAAAAVVGVGMNLPVRMPSLKAEAASTGAPGLTAIILPGSAIAGMVVAVMFSPYLGIFCGFSFYFLSSLLVHFLTPSVQS